VAGLQNPGTEAAANDSSVNEPRRLDVDDGEVEIGSSEDGVIVHV
jgi:hypothetical protein